MKIAFRPSGKIGGDSKHTGRGEYELAGRQGIVDVADVIDCRLDFQISPWLKVPGNCYLRRESGKPRLRLDDRKNDEHIYRWLSSLLLMPKPVRRLVSSPSDKNLIDFSKEYLLANIQVDVAQKEKDHCYLRPTVLEIKQGEVSSLISIPERLGRIQAVLANSAKFPKEIDQALTTYKEALNQPLSHKLLKHLRDAIQQAVSIYRTDSQESADPLVFLESILSLDTSGDFEQDTVSGFVENQYNENDQRSEIQIRSDYVRAWRHVAERGYQGRKFSKSVIDAYDSRCVISGYRLPKTELNMVPGVDAAHILPWAKYDLDTVNNGLCLSKTYHWAFDSGILQVIFDRDTQSYKVIIDNSTEASLLKSGCDVELFKPHLGKIDESRLPKDKSLWPNPDFLDEFNKTIRPQSEAAIPAS